MRKNDLNGRVKRTISCQMKKLCGNILDRLNPQVFFKIPYLFTMLWHVKGTGKLPNLHHPKDFNELLMSINLKALKNEKQRQIRIRCADKYEVRGYIKEKGYEDTLIDCYGVFSSFDDIDFVHLPNQFVLKMTGGSNMNYICTNKSEIDINQLRSKVAKWFDNVKTYGLKTAEWHYSFMPPRIIIEKYMSAIDNGSSLIDYKFHCFNGHPYLIDVGYDRNPQTGDASFDTYDLDWNVVDYMRPEYHLHSRPISKPKNFELMKKIASDLSSNVDYVRVDLYEVGGKIYFGELTYTPSGNIACDYKDDVLLLMVDFYKDSLKRQKEFQ